MVDDDTANVWYYVRDGKQQGPTSAAVLREYIKNQIIDSETLVWREGISEWVPIVSIDAFAPFFPANRMRLRKEPEQTVAPLPADLDLGAELPKPEEEVQDVSSLLRGNVDREKEIQAAPARSFEFKFFWVTFLMATIATAVLHFVKPEALVVGFVVQGALCWFVGVLIFRIETFRENVLWGIGGLVVGVTDLVFLIMFWDRVWRCLLLMIAGGAIAVGALVAGVMLSEEFLEEFDDWTEVSIPSTTSDAG